MVTLTIDEIQVTVPPGTMIVEAAARAGIRIPTLCDNKRLMPFGACRICVVQQKGRRGLIPACFSPVRHGMEILTKTPEIVHARRTQLQLMLISHPLDCLICDAGGQCRLQDLVYEYGIAENPFRGEKANEPIDHVSPFIERNTNRCILCGMCVRIDDEVVGANELSFMNRGIKVKIGTDFDRPMNCEFCGQCISVCPVGALNDRLFLHKARPWDLQETNTVCGYCSTGCMLTIGSRNDRILRVRADENLGVNEGNLCVKGRFGWEYIHSSQRLTTPLVRKEGVLVPATWEEALGLAARLFLDIRNRGNGIAGLGSARITNEEAYLFQKLLRGGLHTNNVDHAGGYAYAGLLALRDALGFAASTVSFRDIREADVIFALRADLSETHPVVKYEIVQAVKNRKAKLIVVDSLNIGLNKFAAVTMQVRPGTEADLVNGMIRAILDEGRHNEEFLKSKVSSKAELEEFLAGASPERVQNITNIPASSIREAARLFAAAGTAVILISSGNSSHVRDRALATAAVNLGLVTGRFGQPGSGLMLLGDKNNSQGALDMGLSPSLLPGYIDPKDQTACDRLSRIWGMNIPADPGMNMAAIISAAEQRRLQGLYLVGENPLATYPEPGRIKRAFGNLELLVVQDCFLTEAAGMAHIVFPAAAFAEKEGTFTSAERRVQRVRRAVAPPGEARSDLWIFSALAGAMGLSTDLPGGGSGFSNSSRAVMDEIRTAVPLYAGINYERLEATERNIGLQWPCTSISDPGMPLLYGDGFPNGKAKLITVEEPDCSPDGENTQFSGSYPWCLVTGPVLFHCGTMSTKSSGLMQIRGEGYAEIHPEDARKLRCAEGDWLQLESPFGKAIARATISRRVASGVVFLPENFGQANILRGRDLSLTRVKITKGQQ